MVPRRLDVLVAPPGLGKKQMQWETVISIPMN